jgi:hypothetical protein
LLGYLVVCNVYVFFHGCPSFPEYWLAAPSSLGTKAMGFFGWGVFEKAATFAGVIGGGLALLALLDDRLVERPAERAALFIAGVSALAQIGLILFHVAFFDRYILMLLPSAIMLVVLCASRWRFVQAPAVAGLLALAAVSWAGEKDFLAWNAAKWQAGLIGVRGGLAPGEIAAQFDWEGYWTYEKNMALLRSRKPLSRIGEWEWVELNSHKAAVSFVSRWPGHTLLARVPYSTPLARGAQDIYLWRR